MANVITNTLTAFITATEDNSSNVPINRGNGNPNYDVTTAQYTEDFVLASGANIITLPCTPVSQLYIRNKHAANTVQVTWTDNGGAPLLVITLNPGDQILLWADPTKTTPGITSLTLTASGASTNVEMFLGGGQ